MADDADRAGLIEAEYLARGLANIKRVPPPEGISGECDECGMDMPRLVGGRCGFCRDGRRPPLSFYDEALPPSATEPATEPPSQPETEVMPSAPFTVERKISFEGEALAAIETYAATEETTFKQAATTLILRAIQPAPVASHLMREVDTKTGITTLAGLQMDTLTAGHSEAVQPVIDLATISAAELLDALRDRLDRVSMADDLARDLAEVTARTQAAERRADAAEIKLRLLRDALVDDDGAA